MKSKEVSLREAALDFLIQWEKEQAYSNLLLNQTLRRSQFSDKDRRLFTELVYGSIQRLNSLDWMINRLVKKGVYSLDSWVRQLLRLSIYQLMFLDKIPSHAAVFESVKIAKKRGHKGIAGFVNGVLRSLLRQKETLLPPSEPKTIGEKEISYSHPGWLIKRMEEIYGEDETQKMLQANNSASKITVRVNQLKTDRKQWIELWGTMIGGGAVPSLLCGEGVVIESGVNPVFTSLFKDGLCTVQDESSMLVAYALDPKPGMSILDACAAPGGKTTHLAERMGNKGCILACDIHPHKLRLIEENVNRLGTSIIKTKLADVRKLSVDVDMQFDAILLDAPCTGLGVIRRKPDIKWTKDPRDIDALVEVQRELLHGVAPLLKTGGILVYSTCTTETRENQEQISHFLKGHPEFEWSSFQEVLSPIIKERAILGEGWLQILPHHFASDGFFIAKLRKGQLKKPS